MSLTREGRHRHAVRPVEGLHQLTGPARALNELLSLRYQQWFQHGATPCDVEPSMVELARNATCTACERYQSLTTVGSVAKRTEGASLSLSSTAPSNGAGQGEAIWVCQNSGA